MADDTDEAGPEYVTATRPMLRRHLQRMDPEAFEHFVADLWTHLGWQTRVVGKPGDRGVDVVATAEGDTDSGGPQTQLIQAKRYGPETTVGSPEVQQYASLRLQAEDVDQVTIVTTGTFSRQAEAMAPDIDVLLVDGEALLGLVLELEAADLLADYLDAVELAAEVETDGPSADREVGGLIGWLRSIVGR